MPMLTLGFGVDIRYAAGSSLVSVIATCLHFLTRASIAATFSAGTVAEHGLDAASEVLLERETGYFVDPFHCFPQLRPQGNLGTCGVSGA